MDNQEFKRRNKLYTRPIMSLLMGLMFLSIVFLSMMFSSPKTPKQSQKARNTPNIALEGQSYSYGNYDSEILAVVIGIDELKQEVTMFNVNTKEALTLTYNGASDIRDRYDQIITINQITIGSMVDVGYQMDTDKLIKMQLSTKVWEYIEVSNFSIDRSLRIIKIGTKVYQYFDDIIILDSENLISIDDVKEQDVLTIRGLDETAWSVIVNKGHGSVKLVDTEGFQGGNVTVGYEAMQQITENMEITVREGNFNLTVENGEYSVTKNIDIIRNEETLVSLKDLEPKLEETSKIIFNISPFGADLFIDGKLTSYANPIELTFGNHDIMVSLGGYTTYKGNLNVREENQVVNVTLPEASSKKEEDFTESSQETIPDRIELENDVGEMDNNEVYTIDEDHFIYVQNPVEASVYLNGEYMGTSPIGFEKMIGTHVITFIKDGFEVKSYTIEVEDDGLNTYLNMPDLVPLE